jgi:ubiquinone/menaquinone biosynthesis C-methylase UbiE
MPNLFDGPMAKVTMPIMARMNRDAEVEAVERLAPRPSDRVLAIGFGPGVGVALLADRLKEGRVLGVDPSEAMVEAAARRNRVAIEAGKVELRQAAASAIPSDDASFDGAVAVNSLQFCEPLADTARELSRVLKPGARLMALTHGWALEKHAGSVEAWAWQSTRAFETAGFAEIRCFRGRAEKGRIVAFTTRRS